MKKLLFTGLLVLSLTGCMSMPTPTSTPMTNVVDVVEINGQTKDQIFEKSKIWIAKSFKSANNVIQYQDKSTGQIIGKGTIPFPCEGFIDCGAFGQDRVNFTIQIDTKDNKARISFSDITATSLTYVKGGVNNIGGERQILIVEHQQRIESKLKSIAQQYKADVVNQQTESKDW